MHPRAATASSTRTGDARRGAPISPARSVSRGRDELAFYRERRGMKWNGLPSRQPGLSPCAAIASFTRTAAAAPSVLHRSALSAFSG